ncbi:acetyl esterase [Actinocorallia herbida]|uniref:Acetyl esterase n=1 Tax=Actinocorallia herbida TaxID=58109 RepID=A0A3N1DBC9_9ACTN|nr:alpha/beta hydrolase [Actinocorallia herbida]ROO90825.1 acetyl esterase [Actinocorallia herbida]
MSAVLPAGLDPGLRAVLRLIGDAPLGGADFDPLRARAAFRALTVAGRPPSALVPVGGVEEVTVPGPSGALACRVYRPEGRGPFPTVVFLHGGGFVLGDLDTHEGHCRRLCAQARAVVLSVGYRRAPEHPFPAAFLDARAAVRWAAAEIGTLGGAGGTLAVAGDSAGGNLAAALAQDCRDRGGPVLGGQLLVYPAIDLTFSDGYPSRFEFGEGLLLTLDAMAWFRECYLGADPGTSPWASPIRGDLRALPPAIVVTAEFDPLRDEGEAYAAALRAAGVPVECLRFAGLIHGSFELPLVSPACAEAAHTAFAAFGRLLRGEAAP